MSIQGLSKSRLQRLHQVLSGYVERREMPGLVALVSHGEELHVEVLGTSGYTDPGENVIGILFTQRMMDSPQQPPIFTDFWTLAYGALEG